MSRYEPLTHYLEACQVTETPLTFKEVERILKRDLPASARLHQPWWANTTTHSHADAWMRAGWKTSRVDLASERVTFVKVAGEGREISPGSEFGSSAEDQFVVRLRSLPEVVRSLLERHVREHACSFEQATADLLTQAAIDRKRRLLERFPLSGERSSVDSVDLIREGRDGR
jgi:hypothetical protein